VRLSCCSRHTDAGKPVHVDTLVRYLQEGGLVWKRTRHQRDDAAFERSGQEIEALRAQAQAGEISLAYFDGRLCAGSPNRSAWTV
jgi:agmatine/peptidylarginine deiminase